MSFFGTAVEADLRRKLRHQMVQSIGLHLGATGEAIAFHAFIGLAKWVAVFASLFVLADVMSFDLRELLGWSALLLIGIAVLVIATLIATIGALWTVVRLYEDTSRSNLLMVLTVLSGCVLTVILVSQLDDAGVAQFAAALALAVFTVYLIGERLRHWFRRAWVYERGRYVVRRFPEVFVVIALLDALAVLRNEGRLNASPTDWADEVAWELNRAANILDGRTPYWLDNLNGPITKALSSDLDDAAARLRAIGLDIARKGPAERENTASLVAEALGLSLHGRWCLFSEMNVDGLPKLADEPADLRLKARQLVAAILPIGAVAVIQVAFDLMGPIAAYAWLATAIWAAVGVVSLLDPKYVERIEAFKIASQGFGERKIDLGPESSVKSQN